MDHVLEKECLRKDPDAIQYWHKDYPSEAGNNRREDILADGLKMLAPRRTISLLNMYLGLLRKMKVLLLGF